MQQDDFVGCWEFWKCSEEAKGKCPVYKAKDGKRCWIYTHNLIPFMWANPKKSFKSCTECPWYKKIQIETGTKK